jgi:hypothetical protein
LMETIMRDLLERHVFTYLRQEIVSGPPYSYVYRWYFKHPFTGFTGRIQFDEGRGKTKANYHVLFDYVFEYHYKVFYDGDPSKAYPTVGYRRFMATCLSSVEEVDSKIDSVYQELCNTDPKWYMEAVEEDDFVVGGYIVEMCSNKNLPLAKN